MNKLTPEYAIGICAKLLKVEPSSLECRKMPIEDNVLYVYQKFRGGGTLLVGEDGSVLFALSSVTFDVHLEAFRSGRRTDPALFDN